MKYILNTQAMEAHFFVPSGVVDSHLKLATHTQLKVLLFFLRNLTTGTSEEAIAEFLKLPVSEVDDALEFWAQAGVLVSIASPAISVAAKESPKTKAVKPVAVKPTREEIASVASTDERLAFLLREAEMKLARALRAGEMQSLAWLYLDHGMDVSVILMIVECAISDGKATVSYIEKMALKWINDGIDSVAKAEEHIIKANRRKTAWGIVAKAFGIADRIPSDNELKYAQSWVIEWKFSDDMLRRAYNLCIDKHAKISMPYINGILENWFKDGITTPEEAARKDEQNKNNTAGKNAYGVYDKKLVDQLLNSDDDEDDENYNRNGKRNGT